MRGIVARYPRARGVASGRIHENAPMEIRQLKYFVRVVELGSISRAARELALVQSALSQQISRLENELSTRLLQRTTRGVAPTAAGLAFFREAQLTLRHAEQAVRAAQQARLTGSVSVGLAPTTASLLALPLMLAMRQRYPDVRLHLVESMSGHLASMLNARELDLAVLFEPPGGVAGGRHLQIEPLFAEDIYLIRAAGDAAGPHGGDGERGPASVALARLADEPLILPTGPHGLRSTLDAAFRRAGTAPRVVMEIDSLAVVMRAVRAGLGSTLQPRAAIAHGAAEAGHWRAIRVEDDGVQRLNSLCSLSDDELSPAALAVRVVLIDCVRQHIADGLWPGTALAG
jgi:LysR family tcuABC transcriptional regulator